MVNNTSTPIIIDNGSGNIKAGFACDNNPSSKFPSIVGRPKLHDDINDFYIGKDAQNRRELLRLRNAIEFGAISQWEDIEVIWQHVYNQLKAAPEEHPILLTENILNFQSYRQKITQIMFEEFKVPSFYISLQAVLSMYSAGMVTGIVHCSGCSISNTIPVYEGFPIYQRGYRPWDFPTGHCLTDHLMSLLNAQGNSFNRQSEPVIEDIKKKLCYVSLDYEHEMAYNKSSETYHLPDGKAIVIDQATQINVPEVVFQPRLLGIEDFGVHELIENISSRCDPTIKKLLSGNVVVAEGHTLFPGFKRRLEMELKKFDPDYAVTASPYEGCSAWQGGGILATTSTFKDICVTREEYNEYGPVMVTRKCF